jgi:hypothetical protein
MDGVMFIHLVTRKDSAVTTKNEMMQRLIRLYKEENNKTEVDMHAVAKFAMGKGWKMPVPKSPLELLAAQFSDAAREEIRRANHAVVVRVGPHQMSLWYDIDEAPRHIMHKSLMSRRDQMVGDGLMLSFDADHWNSVNPTAVPITIPLDFTQDIEWRKAAPDEDEKAA